MGCPLVVIIGVGKFASMSDLYVNRDYTNIIFSLNYVRGYHCAYYSKDNKLQHITKKIHHNRHLQSKNFKLNGIKKIFQHLLLISKQI